MQEYRSFRSRLILASKGLAMGTADIIPGVSGGTIALISGIYDHLVDAIGTVKASHALALLNLIVFCWHRERRSAALSRLAEIDWNFLLPLLAGIALAMIIMVQIIPWVLEHHAFYAFSFFFGLIIFSITVPYRMMKHRPLEIGLLIVFALATFFLVGLSGVSDARIELTGLHDRSTYTLRANQKGGWHVNLPLESIDRNNQATIDQLEIKQGVVQRWQGELFHADGRHMGSFVLDVMDADATSDPTRADLNADEEQNASGAEPYQVVIVSRHLKDVDVFVKSAHYDPATGQLQLEALFAQEGAHNPAMLLLSGSLAISAMILPGISGAYILVLMGQYRFLAASARDLMSNLLVLIKQGGNDVLLTQMSEQALALVSFGLGLVIGIFVFVRILKYLLHHFHSPTMAALTGLMLGSLRYLWPPNHFQGPELAVGDWFVFIVIALVGGLAVFALERAASRLQDPDAPLSSSADEV
ncbi:MAG: DUF368 domain-containing protein [Leptospiraceae bacterium]|nr:DUF368 domain-containing protein [Leptospiraceae bacterium]